MPFSFSVRPAVAADAAAMHAMIVELAVFEREPAAVRLTEQALREDGWGAKPAFRALMAEGADSEPLGYALYYPIYSTWEGRSAFLEDVYVKPPFRGAGVGGALIAAVAAECVAAGCARLDWNVLAWNQGALEVYGKLGARRMEEWRLMRLSGESLLALGARGEQVLRFAQDDPSFVGIEPIAVQDDSSFARIEPVAVQDDLASPATPGHSEERSDEEPALPHPERLR